ncbi:ATP-binding protein [Actinocrinis puniceicyclus]|uniref:ATP-binding protein n=1 Tax=Actinocrinis puniceicyclus TaxID=977794 RepID=A0A8J7WSW1_9ACTN|nr:ATP-binding protein [Actinocrinis puniceicyclus]MBS2965070.1 ATP-binding protein [Actinocrinis puniceicyclus]
MYEDNPGGTERLPKPRTVVLSIPADREQVVLVRSVAGHIAARLGLSVAELTDLRLAVDEACGLFLLSPGFGSAGELLECRFEELPGALSVTVSAPAPAAAQPDVEDIGWIMLSALVDELTWKGESGVARLTLVKHLSVQDS